MTVDSATMAHPVAVAITTHTVDLDEAERISLERAIEVLGPRHDLYLVVPRSLDVASALRRYPELRHQPVDDSFFGGAAQHNRLLLSSALYGGFSDYEYVLIHHLDAYVFRDELDEWCTRGYDFVGAPWLEGYEFAVDDAPYLGTGNGGLSLRKVDSFIQVTRRLDAAPSSRLGRLMRRVPYKLRAAIREATTPIARRVAWGGARREIALAYLNRGSGEDTFWAFRVSPWLRWFRVAPPEVAVSFAFDTSPDLLFERNGRQLPFGCHGWPKADRVEWWRRHIPMPDDGAAPEA